MKTKLSLLIPFVVCSLTVVSCQSNTEKEEGESKTEQMEQSGQSEQNKQEEPVSGNPEEQSGIQITNESGSMKYCYIVELKEEKGERYLVADFVQFLYGDKAVEVAKKRGFAEFDIEENGDTVYSVTNNYVILNDNPKLRTFRLPENTYIRVIDFSKESRVRENVSPSKISTDGLYTITYTNGVLDSIWEEYLP